MNRLLAIDKPATDAGEWLMPPGPHEAPAPATESGPFRDREHMLNCLLDEEIRAYRRPGMTAGQLAPLLSTDELRSLYWDRKIREYADANGLDPDADA